MDVLPPGIDSTQPEFERTRARFASLGVPLAPAADGAEAHRAVLRAIKDAEPRIAPLLEDLSRVERAAYELGLFAPLLRASLAAEPAAPSLDAEDEFTTFVVSAGVRLVRTRWEWDADAADPTSPREVDAVWALHLAPSGPLRVLRLEPLHALLLTVCAHPQRRGQLRASAWTAVSGDAERVHAYVDAQVDALCAAGLLRVAPRTAAGELVAEMRRFLLEDESPEVAARSLVGALARATRGVRTAAGEASRARGDADAVRRLDVAVDRLDGLLDRAGVRATFAPELDAYRAGGDLPARLAALGPPVDVLARALEPGTRALPPALLGV